MCSINRVTRTFWGLLLGFVAVFTLAPEALAEGKPRVAVFDPATTSDAIDSDTRVAVRELICSALVNSGGYTILERAMLDKVMKESKFTNSAVVDETQATELGKLAGANKVVLPVLSKVGGKIMLSVKLIDVTTASVELQKATVTDPDNLLADVEPLTAAMLGQEERVPTARSSSPSGKVEAQHDTVAVLEDFVKQICAIYNIELGVTTISELEQRFNKKAKHKDGFQSISLKDGTFFRDYNGDGPIFRLMIRTDKIKEKFPQTINHLCWQSPYEEWNNWFTCQGFKRQLYKNGETRRSLEYRNPPYFVWFLFGDKGTPFLMGVETIR